VRHTSLEKAVSSRVALVIWASIVVVVASCASQREEAVDTGGVDRTVALADLLLSDTGSELVRVGSDLVIADGLAREDGSPGLRIWTVRGQRVDEAVVRDYENVGPLADITMGTIGNEVILVGQECPQPFEYRSDLNGASEPGTEGEQCGSTNFAVLALTPETGEVRELVERLSNPDDTRALSLVATNDSEALLQWRPGNDMLSVDLSGGTRSIAAPNIDEGADTLDVTAFCGHGSTFSALVPNGSFAHQTATARSLNDYFSLEVLDGDSWVLTPLPSSDVATTFATTLGCTGQGILTHVDMTATMGRGVQVLATASNGTFEWKSLPLEGVEVDDTDIVDTTVIGDSAAIVVGPRFFDNETQSEPPFRAVYGSEGNRWHPSVRLQGFGADAFLDEYSGVVTLRQVAQESRNGTAVEVTHTSDQD
jgi:hypothetical protein